MLFSGNSTTSEITWFPMGDDSVLCEGLAGDVVDIKGRM